MTSSESHHDPATRWQLGTLLAVCVIALLLTGFHRWKARTQLATNETAALATLRYLSMRMNEFKDAAVVDQDGDGVGEFPFMAEITGLAPPRAAGGALAPEPSRNFLARTILGDTALASDGIGHKSGYCFRIWLPSRGTDPSAIPDPGRPRGGSPADADAQEASFVLYAWPERAGTTGNRTFVITQEGEPQATTETTNPYSTGNAPAADAHESDGRPWASVRE